ncbi:MAG: hypothetical protein AB7J32_15205 [Pseudonocardia sp.]
MTRSSDIGLGVDPKDRGYSEITCRLPHNWSLTMISRLTARIATLCYTCMRPIEFCVCDG